MVTQDNVYVAILFAKKRVNDIKRTFQTSATNAGVSVLDQQYIEHNLNRIIALIKMWIQMLNSREQFLTLMPNHEAKQAQIKAKYASQPQPPSPPRGFERAPAELFFIAKQMHKIQEQFNVHVGIMQLNKDDKQLVSLINRDMKRVLDKLQRVLQKQMNRVVIRIGKLGTPMKRTPRRKSVVTASPNHMITNMFKTPTKNTTSSFSSPKRTTPSPTTTTAKRSPSPTKFTEAYHQTHPESVAHSHTSPKPYVTKRASPITRFTKAYHQTHPESVQYSHTSPKPYVTTQRGKKKKIVMH
jgi:hypothetical protein